MQILFPSLAKTALSSTPNLRASDSSSHSRSNILTAGKSPSPYALLRTACSKRSYAAIASPQGRICAAPEGNQSRDERMTVIEMQEYMRASRNKAYDLIWSGEVGSYRLGRKFLVSRASVDAYIESRSGRR